MTFIIFWFSDSSCVLSSSEASNCGVIIPRIWPYRCLNHHHHSPLAKLGTVLGNLWYLRPVFSLRCLWWVRECSPLWSPQSSEEASGACVLFWMVPKWQSLRLSRAQLQGLGDTLISAARSWEPHEPFLSVRWWKLHKWPNSFLRRIVFCSALEKLFFILL